MLASIQVISLVSIQVKLLLLVSIQVVSSFGVDTSYFEEYLIGGVDSIFCYLICCLVVSIQAMIDCAVQTGQRSTSMCHNAMQFLLCAVLSCSSMVTIPVYILPCACIWTRGSRIYNAAAYCISRRLCDDLCMLPSLCILYRSFLPNKNDQASRRIIDCTSDHTQIVGLFSGRVGASRSRAHPLKTRSPDSCAPSLLLWSLLKVHVYFYFLRYIGSISCKRYIHIFLRGYLLHHFEGTCIQVYCCQFAFVMMSK